eukprot:scaffold803_cov310-Pinguiococcus_pyrenoidosus.AAC.161
MLGLRTVFVSVLVGALLNHVLSFRVVKVAGTSRESRSQLLAAGDKEEKGFFGKFFEELDNFIDDAT